jgi:hypothetical protein
MYRRILKKRAAICLLVFVGCQPIVSNADSETTPSVEPNATGIRYEGRNALGFLTGEHDDGFDQYLDRRLGQQLKNEFPGIQIVLAKSVLSYNSPTMIAAIRAQQQQLTKLLIKVLEKSENAPANSKPVLLLASVRLAARLNTADLSDPAWRAYRPILEKYGIVYKSDPVKGALIYDPALHDIWRQYPETSWGRDAFLLDLKNAFGCKDGAQEYHVMIRLGGKYLRNHPDDPRNPWVNFVIAVAFEDWYAMAEFTQMGQNSLMSQDDVDTGISPTVRNSAIQAFLKTALGAPHTELATAAAAGIKGLSSGLPPDDIAFACATR